MEHKITDKEIVAYSEKFIDNLQNNPHRCFSDYDEKKCEIYRKALFKCIDNGHDLSSLVDGMPKETIMQMEKHGSQWKLNAILEMGKWAKAGDKEAELDLEKFITYGPNIASDKILSKYLNRYNL